MFNMILPTVQPDVSAEEVILALVMYLYLGFTQMTLARRLGILPRDAWLAWLPFANIYLLTRMAGVAWWFMLAIFVPYMNYALIAILWSQIGTRLKKPFWIGILSAVPYFGVLIPGYFVLDQKPRI